MKIARALITLMVVSTTFAACRMGGNLLTSNSDDTTQSDDAEVVPDACDSVPVVTRSMSYVFDQDKSDWNDYIRWDEPNKSFQSQDSTVCTGAETRFNECIHAGVVRSIELDDIQCLGFTAQDSLGVFDWRCLRVQVGQPSRLVSYRLKPGKGLRDLINDSGDGFKQNSVTVYKDGCPVFQSPMEDWWDDQVANPVIPLPENAGGVETLNLAGRVYYADDGFPSGGFFLNADRVSVVVGGDTPMTYTGVSGNCALGNQDNLICLDGNSFGWVETDIDDAGQSDANGSIRFFAANFSRVRNTTITNVGGAGVLVDTGSVGARLENVVATDSSGFAFRFLGTGHLFHQIRSNNNANGLFIGATDSVVSKSNFSQNQGTGISAVTALRTKFVQVVAANNGITGVAMDFGNQNVLHGITSMNNGSFGVSLLDPSHSVTNVVSVNNVGTGVFFSGSTIRASHIYSANNVSDGFNVAAGSNNNIISAPLYAFGNGQDCNENGSTNPGLQDDCSIDSGGAVDLTMDPASDWLGPVDDSVNTDDNGGSVLATTISDFIGFENIFRSWGRSNIIAPNTFPEANHRGPCDGAVYCEILDMSILDDGDDLYYKFADVPGTRVEFEDTVDCPDSVDPSVASNVHTTDLAEEYLVHAFEITGDMIGDDDGLCEHQEFCYYHPHMGAFAGKGGWSENLNRCSFEPTGGFSGVIIYQLRTE